MTKKWLLGLRNIPISELEYKTIPYLWPKWPKLAKIDTPFMTKTAEKPYPTLWGHAYLYSPHKGVPPPRTWHINWTASTYTDWPMLNKEDWKQGKRITKPLAKPKQQFLYHWNPQPPCLRMVLLKFELINRDSEGAELKLCCPEVNVSWQERHWDHTTFLSGNSIK